MNFYTHKLQLIERTKIIEGIVCQSITFTNSLFNSYLNNRASALYFAEFMGYNQTNKSLNNYLTPEEIGKTLNIISPKEVAEKFLLAGDFGAISFIDSYKDSLDKVYDSYVTITQNNQITTILSKDWENTQITIDESIIIEYVCRYEQAITENHFTLTAKYIIQGVKNYYPTKPYTITSGINRILDLAEPLFLTETPRFVLNPIQAKKWENTPLPNTTMTQCTLREQLQHIGNYMHGQVRLGGSLDEDIEYNGITYKKGYYENMIFYDEYGGQEESTLTNEPYVANQIRHSINEYNTQIDTFASNVVNSIDYNDGVISSPDSENFKTLRTESANIRLSESNSIIETEFPIYDVISIKVKVFSGNEDNVYVDDDGNTVWDITPFIFEAHEYNSVLSSYGGGYPYSKSYALYYNQGEKNINGLFFKPTTEISSIFGDYVNEYTIVNILESVAPSIGWKNIVTEKFPYLAFQVSYIPFYQTRFSHTDGYILGQERKLPFAKIYNQSENVIETRFYGENIKGVAQRLGNKEATRVYYLNSIHKVPKIGTKLDGYYISQVITEYMPFSIKCTVGLTEKFNRISQNVGISSHKRVAEVSEREAYERNILLKEYICIGSLTSLPLKQSNLQNDTDGATKYMLTGENSNVNYDVQSAVVSKFYRNKNNVGIPIVSIKSPVVSSAFGNCMIFSWNMKDNYSGGTEIENLDNGFWQRDVAYGDYYGRAYWLDFDLHRYIWGASGKDDSMTCIASGESVYNGEIIRSKNPLLLRKDSREIIKMNVDVEYVTNRKDLIIGSGLASCNPLVSNIKKTSTGIIRPRVYFFSNKTTNFDTISGRTDVVTSMYLTANDDMSVSFSIPTQDFESWAIAYTPLEHTKTVYNEDTGLEEEYTTYIGGEILIACNNSSGVYPSGYEETLYIKKYSDKNKDYESA